MNDSTRTGLAPGAAPDWQSMATIAATYSVSYDTVRKWVRRGRVPSIRLGHAVRVDAAALAERLSTGGKV